MRDSIDTKIRFSGLKSGRYAYEFVVGEDFFCRYENEKIHGGRVKYEVILEKTERLMLLNITFGGEITTECDRCLGEMSVPVDGCETLCVKFSDTETSDEEDVVILPESEFELDLSQWFYEYVAVAIPFQTIHEDDENGVPTCDPEMLKFLEQQEGEDEELGKEQFDPRWAKLMDLK